MSAPRMSAKQYRDYLESKHGKRVRVAGKWSGSERRYFYGVLHSSGDYEGETIRITPEDMEKHCYTPDFVTEINSMMAINEASSVSFISPIIPIRRRVYHEVKGNYRLQSQDAARLRWCFAAKAHPEAIFVWSKETGTQSVWDIEIWFDGGRTRVKRRNVIGFSFNEKGGIIWQDQKTTMSSKRSRHLRRR